MHHVGSLLQFIGGAIGRVAATGFLVGLFFVLAGMTPWELVANILQHPPRWLTSPWLNLSMVLVGLAVITFSLRFNQWSQRQTAIDALAEDLGWAIRHLLNRKPQPTTEAEVEAWVKDFREWCGKVSKQLENRAFFTRADQLHFDRLGFVDPVVMQGRHEGLNWHLSQLRLKFERLRDVINWAQQRRP
jgi:hypothetical protein